MPIPLSPRDVLRHQNIPGIWFDEERPADKPPELCIKLRRGAGCALAILNGAILNPQAALAINPDHLEAIALLNPTEAATFFGTQAGSGVLLMWTRAGR